MSNLSSYSYTVLRYVHDTTTGEFINVGVALYAPKVRYASALCRNTYGRLSKTFPGINPEHFKSLMRHVQARFEELGGRIGSELPLDPADSILALAYRILPHDDSALQWSPLGVGRTDDPARTLESLFDRFVMRYEERPVRERRTEEVVWRHFRKSLETKQILRYFQPHRIAVDDDQIEFEHTWKNGILHCLEPLSFDLSSPESIREKAHRWLGKMTSVADSSEKFHLYFLVGEPQEDELQGAYENALSILRKSQVASSIFTEREADQLSDRLAREVDSHEAPGPSGSQRE